MRDQVQVMRTFLCDNAGQNHAERWGEHTRNQRVALAGLGIERRADNQKYNGENTKNQ